MKIVIIGNDSNGLYLFRRQLISTLIEAGNTVTVLTPFDTDVDHLKELGATLIETPMERRGMNPLRDISLMMLYRDYLKKLKPDQVVTYTIKPNIYGGFICRIMKTPYAANVTGLGTAFQGNGALHRFVRFLNAIALKKAKVVFFENHENRDIFVKERIVKQKQTCVLNGAGVDLNHFQYQTYPDHKDSFRFLFIGRIMREKGIEELIEAMRLLQEEGMKCTLDILGHYDEERYKDCLECGVQWLRYHGNQPDVRPFIAECDCFVLPSYHEGMANTNLECAASGRPIITSNISGCKEAVIDGVSGLLCDPRDVVTLYKQMKRMLEMRREVRVAMGKAGRKYMEDIFDKKKVVKETIEHLGF